jgi:tetratricopeptide (TPR) repeat protein
MATYDNKWPSFSFSLIYYRKINYLEPPGWHSHCYRSCQKRVCEEREVEAKILSNGLHGLKEMAQSGEISDSSRVYLDGLIAYLEGDNQKLEELQMLAVASEPTVAQILGLRLAIRKDAVEESAILSVLNEGRGAALLDAEIHFVSAMAYELLYMEDKARKSYLRAATLFRIHGVFKREIKCLQNEVASRSRQLPEGRYISDYQAVAKKAEQCGAKGTAGICYLNISREYQRIGANQAALNFANQSLALLDSEHGSLNFYLALCHRAHLLFQMKRTKEAELDIEMVSIAPFQEVKAAVWAMQSKRINANPPEGLLPTWQERLDEGIEIPETEKSKRSGELENALFTALGNGPCDKHTLIRFLYGDRLSVHVTENRLKNLLNRIRKKYPNVVAYVDGKYTIVDPAFEVTAKGRGA